MRQALIDLAYLAAASLFVVGLKGLSHPRTAVRGNLLGALGMLVAVAATLLDRRIVGFGAILAGLLAGSGVGVVLAARVRMTAMPQMVALLNGFGGAASALVAYVSLREAAALPAPPGTREAAAAAASGIIGAVTFLGSLVAAAKLEGIATERGVRLPGGPAGAAVLLLAALGLGAWVTADPSAAAPYPALLGVSSLLGVLLVLPIGGADMPVVIALLNAYSGLAGAATGFVLSNGVLIIAGSLVGASGIILTRIMCRAMNRPMASVVLGIGAPAEAAAAAPDVYEGRVKAATAEEAAVAFEGARRVVVVPGYGMAVSQAHHAVRDLFLLLESRGVEVTFAVHPVAGRMPGHMNVLLAEADIPYDRLKDLDEANAELPRADVALVVGANDVVNPLARTDPTSPIAGMPILDVGRARTVVVVKRSLAPGYSGIANPLFAADNTLMLFGDGRKAVLALAGALKEVS